MTGRAAWPQVDVRPRPPLPSAIAIAAPDPASPAHLHQLIDLVEPSPHAPDPGAEEDHIMTVRVGINGFGRIGRQSLKALIERTPDVEVVAVNDLVDTAINALLFKHDSTYGAYPGTVDHTDDALIIDGREIKVLQDKDPAALPWGDLGVDIVLESTGLFTDADEGRAPTSPPAPRR